MSDGSDIEWCDATWQPVLGCTRVSAGCDRCYAISVVHRGMSPQHRGLTKLRPKDAARPGVDWNGTVRLQPEKLAEPLRWRKPRRVFVCSLADLFHASVPFEYIAAVFGVMAATPQHTFLVLTKRPERAREFFESDADVQANACRVLDAIGFERGCGSAFDPDDWPLPNVHLGTSVEDQATADERIPHLLSCPAALHWVSAEPLLGPVHLHYAVEPRERDIDFRDDEPGWARVPFGAKLGWVVVGGESGPGAREFRLDWARLVVNECRGADVPVFVKQLGAVPRENAARVEDGGIGTWSLHLRSAKGGDMSEWPADLRVREVPA